MDRIRQRLQREWKIWRVGALPGIAVVILVIIARLAGSLEFAERFALDALLRIRPAESTDERVLIVGIDEEDIRQLGTYPIPDQDLVDLLETLLAYKPRAIGVDIIRDLPVGLGHAKLAQLFEDTDNIIGIEQVLSYQGGFTIDPPPDLPRNQVGFVDNIPDTDGYIRRSLLGARPAPDQDYKFSFTLRLAERYLDQQDIALENGIRDPSAMRFGSVELTQFQPNSGGYVGADAGGQQILINFRNGPSPFRIVPMREVLAGQAPVDWIRDRVVLVGITALSVRDVVNVAAIDAPNPSLVYGVELQAHAISQIISAVLDGRTLLKVWPEGWEYGWIVIWGVIGISLGRIFVAPVKILMSLSIACAVLIGSCYAILLAGWWIPLGPSLLVLVLNGAGLTASLFYRYQQDLKTRLAERQRVIDQTFDTIHNGPLQILARLLRNTREHTLSMDQIYLELESLNRELRAVYESVRCETLLVESSGFHLSSNLELDLQSPTHESLYEIYDHTLTRDFPCFKTLRVKYIEFENIDNRDLTLEEKRGLCRFLEESLCNVGKHAIGMTQLEVVCKQEQARNVIRIIDDGAGMSSPSELAKANGLKLPKGRGTQQATQLAQQLGGHFHRIPNAPKGLICELTWPIQKPWLRRFRKFIAMPYVAAHIKNLL